MPFGDVAEYVLSNTSANRGLGLLHLWNVGLMQTAATPFLLIYRMIWVNIHFVSMAKCVSDDNLDLMVEVAFVAFLY
jgi:hypothetical protein